MRIPLRIQTYAGLAVALIIGSLAQITMAVSRLNLIHFCIGMGTELPSPTISFRMLAAPSVLLPVSVLAAAILIYACLKSKEDANAWKAIAIYLGLWLMATTYCLMAAILPIIPIGAAVG